MTKWFEQCDSTSQTLTLTLNQDMHELLRYRACTCDELEVLKLVIGCLLRHKS